MTIIAAALLVGAVTVQAAERAAPATAFDLSCWKLQIPGPKDIRDLSAYTSDYFYLNDAKELCFHLDAAEKGTTPNAKYVRSELRHLPNWAVGGSHTLSGEFRAVSALTPDKVTAMQIHGITSDGGDAPPLLRVAVNAGDLVALFKTDVSGKNENKVALKEKLGAQWVKVVIAVTNSQLTITVDGQEKLSRSLAYWTHHNYFKAGCYPQAKQGTADVVFRSLVAQ
jgi:hypothetical protein